MKARPVLAGTASAGLLAGLLAGCGGGGAPPVAPPTASPSTASDAASGPASPSSAPPTRPSPPPLSRYEDDRAVKSLRLHYLGSAKLVNQKSVKVPELVQSSTEARLGRMVTIFGNEFGDRYPGPIPFTPVGVKVVSAQRRDVLACVEGDGWLRDAKTGRPTRPRRVAMVSAEVLLVGGSWKVDRITFADGSCTGVRVTEVLFG